MIGGKGHKAKKLSKRLKLNDTVKVNYSRGFYLNIENTVSPLHDKGQREVGPGSGGLGPLPAGPGSPVTQTEGA